MCRAGQRGGMPRPAAMRAPTGGKLQGRGAMPSHDSERKHQGRIGVCGLSPPRFHFTAMLRPRRLLWFRQA